MKRAISTAREKCFAALFVFCISKLARVSVQLLKLNERRMFFSFACVDVDVDDIHIYLFSQIFRTTTTTTRTATESQGYRTPK